MKFKKLEIHNIASLEDAIIDFESEPLSSSEVFLITGKTGSGKSTILDAICLALYNKTPRLANTNMEGYMSDSGNTDKEVSVSDCRQFMRKNTGYAYANLSFTDNDNNEYIASWYVQRAHKKPGRTLQAVNWTLEDKSKATTLTKKKEIENRITEIIGLDFNQFCRTTMLAQGEFTRFLNSKDDEKAQIIEKLTGANIYSKIGRKIFETTRDKENSYKEVQKEVASIKILDSEEVEKKNAELQEIDKVWKERNLEKNSITQKIDWITQKAKLNSDLAIATKEKEEAIQKQQTQDYKDKLSLTQDWNKTIEPRGYLEDISIAKTEQNDIRQRLNQAETNYILGLNSAVFYKKELKQTVSELDSIRASLEAEKDYIPAYNNAQKIETNIENLLQRRLDITKEEQKIEGYKKDINSKQDEISNASKTENLRKKDVETKDKEITILSNEIQELQLKLKESNLNTLTASEKQLNNYLSDLGTAKAVVSKYEEDLKKQDEKKKEIEAIKEKIEKLKEELKAAQKDVSKSEKEKDSAEKEFEWQKTFTDKLTKALRSKLTAGCTCPVCQQKVQNLDFDDELLDKDYNKALEAFSLAKQNYEECINVVNKIQVNVNTQSELYDKYVKEYNEASESIISSYNETVVHCQNCGLLPKNINEEPSANQELSTKQNNSINEESSANSKVSLEGMLQTIEETIQKTQEDIDNLNKKISKANTIQESLNNSQTKLNALQDKRKTLEKLYSSAKEDVKTKENELASLNQSIGACKQNIKSNNEEITTISQKINEYIPDNLFTNNWLTSSKDFLEELQTKVKKYSSQTQKANDYQEIIEQNSKDIKRIENVKEDIIKIMPSYNTLSQVDENNVIVNQNNVIVDENNVIANQKNIIINENNVIVDENNNMLSLENLVTYFNTLYSDIKSNNDGLQKEIIKQQKSEKKLNEYLNSLVGNLFATKIDIPYLEKLNSYSQKEIGSISKEINDIDFEVTSKKSAYIHAQKLFDKHITDKPSSLKTENDCVEGMLFFKNNLTALEETMRELDQKKGGIENELQQDEKNKKSQEKLIEKVEEKKKEFHKWARLNQLIGDSTGKTFQKIAQSYVLSSLIHSANSYMKTLTNRYRLVVEPGTFIIYIEDAYQGYVRRAASTISGGESFLVSLSLALALSDIGHEFAVDTLFIDEGFGTLSGEPLQNAINTLRTLHSKAGRRVGIISHVEELQEKIPVQIKVKQDGNNSSSKVEIITI